MKKDAWKVRVSVVGIAKRQRTLKRHVVKLGTHDDVDVPTMLETARHEASGFRSVERVTLHIDAVEVDQREDGVTWETWSPFDERNQTYVVTM